ncbi:30S ribosomal protein S20 [Deltaproteobacteria bacterium TL4]
MPNHKSSEKRVRQTQKRTLRNNSLESALRTALKKFRTSLEKGEASVVQASFPALQRLIDKGVTKGILRKSTASRYKSRLNTALNKKTV